MVRLKETNPLFQLCTHIETQFMLRVVNPIAILFVSNPNYPENVDITFDFGVSRNLCSANWDRRALSGLFYVLSCRTNRIACDDVLWEMHRNFAFLAHRFSGEGVNPHKYHQAPRKK
ncbi:hypothetical protein [Zavarzinella formosa]|uniref:hypothetical protein n=1 Tax=Zavarzinella formosa TaxID=360055 RepID=UPI0012F9E7FD|nr:hypothetical protein [Zavarzinella formosa]